MKKGFEAIMNVAKVGGIKKALIIGGAIALAVTVGKMVMGNDDDSENTDPEIIDIIGEEVDGDVDPIEE